MGEQVPRPEVALDARRADLCGRRCRVDAVFLGFPGGSPYKRPSPLNAPVDGSAEPSERPSVFPHFLRSWSAIVLDAVPLEEVPAAGIRDLEVGRTRGTFLVRPKIPST